MLFKNIKNVSRKYFLWIGLALVLLMGILLFVSNSIKTASGQNQEVFAYTVKVRDTVEGLDKIFERAEVNVNVMADSISNSYDMSKQQNEAYNMQFVDGINGLIQSVLSNSPGVDGSWFQINADLPFSVQAYNWYTFKESQFIDVKAQFEGTSSMNRKITPEDDPYYFDALTNEKPIWSDIYTDADTKKPMITLSSPIYKEGSLVGVVGIDISVENLQEVLKSMHFIMGDAAEVYLLNKKNKVILFQLPYNSNSVESNYPFLKLFKKNIEGPVEYYDKMVKKTAIKLILSNDYKVVIAMEDRVLFAGTNQLINAIYILLALLIVLTVAGFVHQFETMKINEQSNQVEEETTEEDVTIQVKLQECI